jgi:hypothetical protein
MATRTDTDQTKAADEAARTARTVTDEAARVGEQIKQDEQAHKTADAARADAEKLAKFRQRATEDALRTEEALKSVRSGADAASLGLQSVFDQFARTLGFTGEEGEQRAQQSVQNVEAITKCGTVLTQAYQDTSREWYGLAQKQAQRNLEGLSQLAHCRSVQDFAATQSSLVRESLQSMVEDSRLIAEISLKAVNDASKAVAGTAQEKGRAGALAA